MIDADRARCLATYGGKANGHLRRAGRLSRKPVEDVDLNDLMSSVSVMRTCLKSATVRVYRQELFVAIDMIGERQSLPDAALDQAKAEVAAILEALRGNPEMARTSSKKLKYVEHRKLAIVVRHIIGRMQGGWDETLGPLVLLLALGPRVGIRPIEWSTARLNGRMLVLRNAKTNSSRGTGVHRQLDLSLWPDHIVLGVALLCSVMSSLDGPAFERLYSRMAERLATACRQLSFPRIAPYVVRHMAITDWAAAGLTPECIAAMAGHRSINSQKAYISKGRGARPTTLPRPATGTLSVNPSIPTDFDDSEFEMPMPPRKPPSTTVSWQEHVARRDLKYGGAESFPAAGSKPVDVSPDKGTTKP